MEALSSDQIYGEPLDHLGLVAATIQDCGLMDIIDDLIPVDRSRGAKTSHGQRAAAMILNGLGFIDDRLYMFETFLEGKPVKRLLGSDVEARYFNDDALGRTLDRIYQYGVTDFIAHIAYQLHANLNLWDRFARLDTTTLSVYGDYEVADSSAEAMPAYGYSKQKRMDLKQVILLLATSGPANLPMWMSAHPGNASDTKTLPKAASRIEAFKQMLEQAPNMIYVADSAMYERCVSDQLSISWLSRVPERIGLAKDLVQQPDEAIEWQPLDNGYAIAPYRRQYKGVDQRWLLVFSEQAHQRECQTLERQVGKAHDKQVRALKRLSQQTYQCQADAQQALDNFKKQLKYHTIEAQIEPIWGYTKPGAPKKGEQPVVKGYRIQGDLVRDESIVSRLKASKGRFILATNVPESELSNDQMLVQYKAQTGIERGFQFIKDDMFELDAVFLKKPERIEALMAIMTLCLMMFNLASYQLHQTLKKHDATVKDQLNKPTQKPSLAWIFRQFYGIQVLCMVDGEQINKMVINVKPHLAEIVEYFGRTAMAIYGLSGSKNDQ